MEQNSGKATAGAIRNLIAACETSVFQVCKRSGVTPSTFYRWVGGSEPNANTVNKMRAAIVGICLTAKKPLPDVLLTALDTIVSTLKSEDSSQKVDLTSRVERLEIAVHKLGGTL